jgi:hypothetical protein
MGMENSILLLSVGAGLTLLGSLINLVANYYSTKLRAREDREEDFKIKLTQLRLDASQRAYQYIFQIHRALSRGSLDQALADEARSWLDGQVIILGDDIYTAVFSYINHTSTNTTASERANAMDLAVKKLKSVLKYKN